MKKARGILGTVGVALLSIVAASCSSTTANNATPILSNVSPAAVIAGSKAFQLDVVALNAITTSVVMWNQTNLSTTLDTTTGDLVAQVPASLIAKQGSAQITVFNPSPGGGQSNSLTFFIDPPNNPAPTLSSISPSITAAGGATFALTLTGTNFVSTSSVSWNGSPRPTAYVSATELKATILASDIATAGKANVTVVNPSPGGGVSGSVVFTITDPSAHEARHAAGAKDSSAASGGNAVQVSLSAAGGAADGVSGAPRISANGRYVAFESRARNLVAAGSEAGGEIFVRDTCESVSAAGSTDRAALTLEAACTARTEAVDVGFDGSAADAPAARGLAISANGRYVGFASRASNLVAGIFAHGHGDGAQIYLRDTCMGAEEGCEPRTMLISGAEGLASVAADGPSEFPSMSADGRYVAFTSTAGDLLRAEAAGAAGVSAGIAQIYLRDTCIGAPAQERCVARTELVSVDVRGEAGKGPSLQSSLSADGRYVAFDSAAGNLVKGAHSGAANVYVRDTCAGAGVGCRAATVLVSGNVFGVEANGASFEPSISGDGRYVAFVTRATDMGAEFAGGASASELQRIVIRDLCTGAGAGCKASSVMVSGAEEGLAHAPSISADGRAVTFVNEASESQRSSAAAAGLRIYLWRAGPARAEAGATLIAETPAGEAGALPESNARFAVPLSANGAVAAVFSVTALSAASEAALSGKGDVFLVSVP